MEKQFNYLPNLFRSTIFRRNVTRNNLSINKPIKRTSFIYISRGEGQKPEHGPFLPFEIHRLYETSLSNLVGCEKLPPEYCGEEVFKKIRLKFNNAIFSMRKKEKEKVILFLNSDMPPLLIHFANSNISNNVFLISVIFQTYRISKHPWPPRPQNQQ